MIRQMLDPRRGADPKRPVGAKLHFIARRDAAQVHDRVRRIDAFVDRDEKIGAATHRQRFWCGQSRDCILDRLRAMVDECRCHCRRPKAMSK
jgi:hypothetical protein